MTNFNYTENQSRRGVKSKFIVALIVFVLILGAKAISSKSTTEKETIRVSIID